jgi:hypothetical protein
MAMKTKHRAIKEGARRYRDRQRRKIPLIDGPCGPCRVCGCTDDHACMTSEGPCHWVGSDLCSACVGKAT